LLFFSFKTNPTKFIIKKKSFKKRLEKIFSETVLWLEKNKEVYVVPSLDEKINEIETEVKQIYERVSSLIAAAKEKENMLNSTTNLSSVGGGNVTSRSRASISGAKNSN
jgi:hypothetical protein